MTQDIKILSPNTNIGRYPDYAKLLDITNYASDGYIMSTQQMFIGLHSDTPSINYFSDEYGDIYEFKLNSVFTSFANEFYILTGCTSHYLLGYFDHRDPTEQSLLKYNDFNIELNPTDVCSLSIQGEYGFLVHAKNLGNNKINLLALKIPFYDTTLGVFNKEENQLNVNNFELLAPENDLTEDVLVCGYIIKDSINKYKYMAIPANYLSKPYHFDEAAKIYESESLLNFKLYKIDELHIRYLMEGISYEIKIIKDESYEVYIVEKISEAQSNQNLFK